MPAWHHIQEQLNAYYPQWTIMALIVPLSRQAA